MNKQQDEIREQQRQSWNRFSGGWKKWDELTMDFLRPAGEAIVAAIRPSGKKSLLDIASGTGEPGLSMAAMLNGGKVTLTDLSTDMLEIAKENALKRNISNIETVVADVCALPFADGSFDAVSCRFGFMFFPDMQLAANEMARVLKPGGRIATAVWNGPDKNFWVSAMMGTIAKNIELPPPAPGAPGMFRCAQPGLMKNIFEQAGLTNITEKEITTRLHCGTVENYWAMMTEVGAPIVAALSKADSSTVEKIKTQVTELLRQKYGEQDIVIDGNAMVIAAGRTILNSKL